MVLGLGIVLGQHSIGQAWGGSASGVTAVCSTLLMHGARAVVKASVHKADRRSRWVNALVERRNKNIATVALANKNARIIWAMLAREEDYRAAA